MTNAWDDMRKAKEEEYFEKKNREALERLTKKKEEEPRISPVSGKPMVQEVLHGVVVDRCEQSGGLWLDAGELEELVAAMQEQPDGQAKDFFASFAKRITGR